MLYGLIPLLTLRKKGLRPSSVWLSIGVPYVPPRYEQDFERMELCVSGSVTGDDFRVFKGLKVTLFAADWTALTAATLEKLKLYADEITVLIASFGEDIGFAWSAHSGQVNFGEQHGSAA